MLQTRKYIRIHIMSMYIRRVCHKYRLIAIIGNIVIILITIDISHYLLKGKFLLNPYGPTDEESNLAVHGVTHKTGKIDISKDKRHSRKIEQYSTPGSLEYVLENTATKHREIIIMYTNEATIDYALNYIEVSRRYANSAHTHTLFISDAPSPFFCEMINKKGSRCFQTDSGKSQVPGRSAATQIAYKALQYNFTILLIEYDVLLLSDVLHDLRHKCNVNSECNGAIMSKNRGKTFHGALIYFHPSQVAEIVMDHFRFESKRSNIERSLANAISKSETEVLDINILNLAEEEYRKGYIDFRMGKKKRDIAAMAIHATSDWTANDSLFLLRESGLWFMDPPVYYDPSLKYITYSNDCTGPFVDTSPPIKERDALINALVLADVLKRVLILPKFHCWWQGYDCIVSMVVDPMKLLQIDIPLRESSFLDNEKTPASLIANVSANYYITNMEIYTDHLVSLDMHNVHLTPEDPVVKIRAENSHFVTKDEVLRWFGKESATILRLYTTLGLELCKSDSTISTVCKKELI